MSSRMVGAVGGAALSCALTVGAAPVQNGDFESGDLGGWTVARTVAMAPTGSIYEPLAGSFSVALVAVSAMPWPGTPNYCDIDVWNVTCPQPLPFERVGGPALTYGSGPGPVRRGGEIGQDVTVLAGDVITWDWRLFGEAEIDDLWDYGFFTASNGTSLDIVRFASLTTGSGSYSFAEGGLWTISFSLSQGSDNWYYSVVELDNIHLARVPEPASVWLSLFGIGLLWSMRRRAAGIHVAG